MRSSIISASVDASGFDFEQALAQPCVGAALEPVDTEEPAISPDYVDDRNTPWLHVLANRALLGAVA